MKQGALIAAFSFLSAIAVAGWMRHPAPQQAAANQLTAAGYNTPGLGPEAGYPAVQPQGYAAPAPAYTAPAPAYRVQRSTVVQPRVYPAARPVVQARRQRPFSHSVAIVAGSAGGGAAIGALAGGKKGAAIGALAGGAAGLIYDRVTARPKATMSY